MGKMKCKWYSQYEGTCTNDECPYCGDVCRVDEHPEVCRFAEEDVIFSAEELVQALRCCADDGSDCNGCPLAEPSVNLRIESLHSRCYRMAENQAADMLEKLTWQKSGWISVEDELPQNGGYVLCWYEYYRDGECNQTFRTYGIGFQFVDGGEIVQGRNAKPLFWMPLPEPPEE